MNKFEELKNALAAKSDNYSKTTDTARKVLEHAFNLLTDENSKGVCISEDKIGDRRVSVTILINEEPRLAVWYASDGDLGIDLSPADKSVSPITLKANDADEFNAKIEKLIDLAKARDAEKEDKEEKSSDESEKGSIFDLINDVLSKHKAPEIQELIDKIRGKDASSEQEEKFLSILVRVVNTIKKLDGPKYEDLNAYWKGSVVMINSGHERLLVMAKRPDGRIAITDNVFAGPKSMVNVSDKVGELAEQVMDLAKENLNNSFSDPDGTFETMSKIFSHLPIELQKHIINDLLK